MHLNDLHPADGSNRSRRRVGRGIGSGFGKTCGTGHKGQKSRSGGFTKVGFEGGQMPLHMRLPKVGFRSRKKPFRACLRLHELNRFSGDVVTLETLREKGLIQSHIRHVKIFLSNSAALERPLTIQGVAISRGAKAAVEALGGAVVAKA